MKKKLLAIAAIAIMIPLVFCACKKTQPDNPTEPATQEAVTEDQAKNSPAETPEAAILRLIDGVNKLKYVHGVALDSNEEYVYYDDQGYTYTLVTDPKFQSIGDIAEYLFDTFTAKGATDYYPDLALMGQGSEPASYLMVSDDPDVPDGLYELQAYGGFSVYTIAGDITISNLTDQSYTAKFTAEYYGELADITMTIVAENGPQDELVWKVDSITEEW